MIVLSFFSIFLQLIRFNFIQAIITVNALAKDIIMIFYIYFFCFMAIE